MKTIPCTIGFDQSKQIGTLTIDEKKLPKGAGYKFAIGGIVKGKKKIKSEKDLANFELLEIALVPNPNYKKILKRYLD